MKILKRISLVLFFVFCFAFLGGCSADYSISLKENGLIESKLLINLEELESEKREKAFSAIDVYFKQLDKAFEKNTIELYSKIYNLDDIEKDEEKIAYILSRNGFIVNDSMVEIDTPRKKLKLTKSFYSVNASLSRTLTSYYLYFYPSALKYSEELGDIVLSASYTNLMDDIPLSSTLEKNEGAFIAKYVQTCNPLYYNGEEPKFLEDCIIGGKNVSKGVTLKEYLVSVTEVTEEQAQILFSFTTPYNRVHSNATTISSNGSTTHTWSLNGVDATVTFYRNMARPIFWYCICAGVGLIIIAVGLITGIVMKNRKKKIGLEALKKIDELANSKK